jgi:hypothetical protein
MEGFHEMKLTDYAKVTTRPSDQRLRTANLLRPVQQKYNFKCRRTLTDHLERGLEGCKYIRRPKVIGGCSYVRPFAEIMQSAICTPYR